MMYRSENCYTAGNLIKSINQGLPFTDLELGFKYFKDQEDVLPKKSLHFHFICKRKMGKEVTFLFQTKLWTPRTTFLAHLVD